METQLTTTDIYVLIILLAVLAFLCIEFYKSTKGGKRSAFYEPRKEDFAIDVNRGVLFTVLESAKENKWEYAGYHKCGILYFRSWAGNFECKVKLLPVPGNSTRVSFMINLIDIDVNNPTEHLCYQRNALTIDLDYEFKAYGKKEKELISSPGIAEQSI